MFKIALPVTAYAWQQQNYRFILITGMAELVAGTLFIIILLLQLSFTFVVNIFDFKPNSRYLVNMKETLLYLRELNNYSQNFVASYLNISRQMYSKYENGDVDPGVKSVIALCKLYKVSYDVILENKFNDTAESEKQNSFSYRIKQEFGRDLVVASPAPAYSANRENKNYYYQKMISYLPHLTYTQALDMLQKLARKIEVQGQKNRPYTEATNLSDKEAKDLFEYFSGKGEGLDYDSEKSRYLRKKHLGER